VTIQVGTRDPALGRSYAQIAREGWGQQKSQNGGANPAFSGPASTSYHLWAVAPQAVPSAGKSTEGGSLFSNAHVHIGTSLSGLAALAGNAPPAWLSDGLHRLDEDLTQFRRQHSSQPGETSAHALAPFYRQGTRPARQSCRQRSRPSSQGQPALRARHQDRAVPGCSQESSRHRSNRLHHQIRQRSRDRRLSRRRPDETPRSIWPGEEFRVRVHTTWAAADVKLGDVAVRTQKGTGWEFNLLSNATEPESRTDDRIWTVHAPDNAEPTEPYFARPNIEQPYYDLTHPEYREHSFVPYPLRPGPSLPSTACPSTSARSSRPCSAFSVPVAL